jgi:hypothetical protein
MVVRASRVLSLLTLALPTMVAALLVPAAAGASPAPPASVARAPSAPSFPTVVGLRVGRHASFDRVVVDLRGGLPASRSVRYENPLVDDASGKVVHLRGHAFIRVVLHGTVSHDEQGRSTLRTAGRILVDFPALREVNERGDFEAVETIAIGVSQRTSFRVSALRNPDRIVIDVDHPAAGAPTGGALPFTGSHELPLAGMAAALLAAGGVLLAATRRRARRTS